MLSMKEALRGLRVPRSLGASLFLFSTFVDLRAGDPLSHAWIDGIVLQRNPHLTGHRVGSDRQRTGTSDGPRDVQIIDLTIDQEFTFVAP